MDLELEMANRVRRHMLTSLGGVVLGMLLAGGLGGAVAALGGPVALRLAPLLGIVAIPAIGFWSTYRNLRCPSCDRLVALQVSWNYSLFSGMAPKTCNGCGKKIFGDLIAQRFRRTMLVMVAVGFGLGMLGAVASVLTRPH